ncbi:MAG: amidase [Acidimicrobiales bacterium]|nr:amidase [Acidimicrobiales bacterium]
MLGPEVLVPGAPGGRLGGRTLAVKDLFDVAGRPTGAGNPDWQATHPVPERTAPAVQRLLDAGAALVGKTVTDELAFSLSGTNVHDGMPPNPAAPGRVPGGSSAGSASAVADHRADIGLGSDTAGSTRVPASYCGLFGVRPTWGRVPIDGCVPLAPGYDTVGWLTRSAALAGEVGEVLLDPWAGPPTAPLERLVVATDAFALLDPGLDELLRPMIAHLGELLGAQSDEHLAPSDPRSLGGHGLLDWAHGFRLDQARQVWRTHGAWITEHAPRFGPGVAARFGWAATVTDRDVAETEPIRQAARARLEQVLAGSVLVLPAASGPPPLPDAPAKEKDQLRERTLALTCAAGLAGAPVISMPAVRTADGPLNLAIIGARGTDEALARLAVAYSDLAGWA